MPGLIQRYNVAAEYSEMLSTARQRSTSRRASLSSRHAAAGEASEWYHAVCPPLEDFQDVIRRFQRDPEFSQDRVFRFLRPLFVFSILFAVAVFALQPNSFAHHILTAPEEHTKDLAIYGAGILGVLLVGLAILRSLICATWFRPSIIADNMLKSWLTFCTPKSRNIVRNILKAQENGHVMTSQQIYQTARQQFPDEHDLIKEDVVVNYKNEPAMKVNRRPTPPTSRMGRPAVPSNHPLQSLRYLKKVVMEDLVARDEVIKVRVWRGSGGVDEEGNKMDLIVHKGSDNQPVKSLSLPQKESWMWQLNAEKMILEEEPAESNGPDDDPLLANHTAQAAF
ncbi:hypothetical protein A0H81_09708 [Grifola frondosa]|uniref:Uncharacterized protein n=1 Tax=Grifola frondosa TaxID=5627 RepID=A0A1C7M0M6_GRIFR|nr:hypothetical protein A0H81_09708 [Grifola frondosa]